MELFIYVFAALFSVMNRASGINAISRIIGFIVIAIGIEYISSSVVKVLGVVFR